MTRSQKNIVFINSMLIGLIVVGAFNSTWVDENPNIVKVIFFAIIIIIMIFQEKKNTSETNSEIMNRIASEHPWLKLYYFAFLIVLAWFIYHISSNNFFIGDYFTFKNGMLFIGFLIGPVYWYGQKDAYIKAGE